MSTQKPTTAARITTAKSGKIIAHITPFPLSMSASCGSLSA
jgi:hypothetical protein